MMFFWGGLNRIDVLVRMRRKDKGWESDEKSGAEKARSRVKKDVVE
jgi:hypothetical protein